MKKFVKTIDENLLKNFEKMENLEEFGNQIYENIDLINKETYSIENFEQKLE